jgi:desulfoferrodoxin (superoxide reductase-like protein)
VSSSNNLGNGKGSVRNFYGDKGMIRMSNWNEPFVNAEGSPRGDSSLKGERAVAHVEKPDHFLNWLQCIRNNEKTIAPIEAGYQHAVAVLMAMKSYETGRKTIYDHKKRKILTV